MNLRDTTLGRALWPTVDLGASFPKRLAWYFVNLTVVYNPLLPSSSIRVAALRLFGAKIGKGVQIKPQVKIKFPWKLELGDGVGIGEECWIDNVEDVYIDAGAMLSQRVYVCTGNHDWSHPSRPLTAKPVRIGRQAWVCAGAIVGPGCEVGDRAVVTLGSVALGEIGADGIWAGNPAVFKRKRKLKG